MRVGREEGGRGRERNRESERESVCERERERKEEEEERQHEGYGGNDDVYLSLLYQFPILSVKIIIKPATLDIKMTSRCHWAVKHICHECGQQAETSYFISTNF